MQEGTNEWMPETNASVDYMRWWNYAYKIIIACGLNFTHLYAIWLIKYKFSEFKYKINRWINLIDKKVLMKLTSSHVPS